MEGPDGAVDERHLGIISFTERINLGLVIFVGCAINEVHSFTRNVANHNFGDYCWDLGSI